MLKYLYICAGVCVGVLVSAFPSYLLGYNSGKRVAQIEQLKADVDARIKREGINNDVRSMDRYAICIDLGGLPDQCDELRRMEQAAETK